MAAESYGPQPRWIGSDLELEQSSHGSDDPVVVAKLVSDDSAPGDEAKLPSTR